MSVKSDIKKLSHKQCAYFKKSNNNCILTDQPCAYFDDKFIGHCRCIYFEMSVLPSDPVMERKYWEEIAETKNIFDSGSLDKCQRCGCDIVKKSNRQKYCSQCAEIAKRDSTKESMRKKRSNVRN